jgi:hypothetical protein
VPIETYGWGTPSTWAGGVVYLLKAGPFYKIGKSRQFERRQKHLMIQLPFACETIAVIATSDHTEVWQRFTRNLATS